MCDSVVFVDTNWEQRLQRVQQTRNWDASELTKREASQLPIDKKQNLADAVIPNHGKLSEAVESLIAFVDQRFPNLHSS
jgi:dephospho-CoA kinase